MLRIRNRLCTAEWPWCSHPDVHCRRRTGDLPAYPNGHAQVILRRHANTGGRPRAKAAGEKRVLSRFPDAPAVTWDDWRQQPGVFV